MVRKNQPRVCPSVAMRVRVGEEEAGEICTTPAGPVTEVTMGIETEEMMPPMMAGVRRRSTSCRAWSTATLPWDCASRRSKVRRQPAMPCAPAAAFSSLKASSTDLAAAWPKRPAGPVSETTMPTLWVQDGACAAAGWAASAEAATAAASAARRAKDMIEKPPGCMADWLPECPSQAGLVQAQAGGVTQVSCTKSQRGGVAVVSNRADARRAVSWVPNHWRST